MATQYPISIDTSVTLQRVFDLISPVQADDVNRLRDAIVAIQRELNANPSGTFGDVKARLDAVDALISALDLYLDNLTASQVAIADADGYFDGYTVETALQELARDLSAINVGADAIIGPAEDGSYTDGLFTDFIITTPVGTAVDRFNEVLGNLAPAPAPNLSDITYASVAGAAGKLSFGASNVIATYTSVTNISGESALDVNGAFANNSTARRGIYAATFGSKTGVLAGAVTADSGTPTPSYPAQAFGSGDQGTLSIWVNGTQIHSVDLTSFGSGSTTTGGTGFSLSAATSNSFPNGESFTLFKYRTGTWTVATTHERNGHNYAQVRHVVGATTYTTNFFEWVIDNSTTATSYSLEAMSGLTMSGSKYLSGIRYHTDGSATYGTTISNAYRNTFSSSASAISHTETNCSITDTSIANLSGAPYESSTIVVSKTATMTNSGIRLLNGQFSSTTTTDRTVQSDVASSGAAASFLLVDNVSADSADTNHTLNDERYRVASDKSVDSLTGYSSGGGSLWDSTISLVSATAGYTDGLLAYGGSLYYPSSSSVVNSGDFSTIGNAYVNPNYSVASGTRVYWSYFYVGSAKQNFTFNITATGTSFIAASASLGINNGNCKAELLAPATTSNGSTTEFKDMVTAYTTDNAIGCYAATYGSTQPTSWGITLGSKSTATSVSVIVVRFTVGQGFTGSIQNVAVTVL